jgi:hypothetical protein
MLVRRTSREGRWLRSGTQANMIAMTAIVMMVVMIFSSASVEADPAVLPGTYLGVKWRKKVPWRDWTMKP